MPDTPSSSPAPEPCVVVIFGASGDLTHRKLVPALYDLSRQGQLPRGTAILGVSRTSMTDDEFRAKMRPSVETFSAGFDAGAWPEFERGLFYQPADATNFKGFEALVERIHAVAAERGITKPMGQPNVLFYLSVAPSLYEPIIGAIGAAGMVTEGRRWCAINPREIPWQRIIVEKPFGTDLESARSLNMALGRVFEEEAIFRIDHYLGKELVQNILVMRFANTIFEPLWNRNHINHVQVTAAETVGVGARAGTFYDAAGALRDMVQSHLLQVLALVAIEPPALFDAASIMREKIKFFQAAVPIAKEALTGACVLGRYGKGADGPAYVDEPGVNADHKTETYAALRLEFDNWRWAGVPFYLRSGKRLASKLTEIVIQFKETPTNLFRSPRESSGSPRRRPANRLIITIAPREAISIRVEGKVPGAGVTIDSAELDLDYLERFGGEQVEAYGPLILDAIRGDRTLYKHRDEVESGWAICEPFLKHPSVRNAIETYEPGSWGPSGADAMLARESRQWHNPA